MGKIVAGMFLQGIGAGLFYLFILRIQDIPAALIFLALALSASIGGLFLMLAGFREFIMRDVLDELKKISANTATPPKA